MLVLFVLHVSTTAQEALLQPQTNTWNSTFRLTQAQISTANLSSSTAHNVEVALNYERTNNAGDLTQDDPFYQLPVSYDPTNPPPPGTILKVEQHTNTSLYTLPPTLSMSRFLYMTETFNGSSAPASGLVLWPYQPRTFSNLHPASNSTASNGSVYPVVGWAHGSNGYIQACAPSGLRNLWDEFHLPFPVALAGYAVVAPDYLGYGVANQTAPYFILPSQANDLIYAVVAAQNAWSDQLSHEFVLAGQSQGGATTWAAAQRQSQQPVSGYLGVVAASPFTDVLAIIAADKQAENNWRVSGIAQGLHSVLPSFQLSDWLTKEGIARLGLLQSIQGCGTTAAAIFGDTDVQILQTNWNHTSAAAWYKNASSNGEKAFAGPMLIIQGTDDPNANEPVNTRVINQTCSMFPAAQLQYIRYEAVTHAPVLYAGQYVYLDWIRDRFEGVNVPQGCKMETLRPARGIPNIQKDQNWFIEYDVYGI